MGAGGSVEMTSASPVGSHPRYYCHGCHRIFQVPSSHGPVLQCIACDSGAIEEYTAFAPVEYRGLHTDTHAHTHAHTPLTSEQARRITNATTMLRLLEQQLREELEQLQQAFDNANQRHAQEQGNDNNANNNSNNNNNNSKRRKLTAAMRVKLRQSELTLDSLCSQPSCPICSEDFCVGAKECMLPCSHIFHSACVLPWLEIKGNCPICRAELTDTVPEATELYAMSVEEIDEKLREIGVEVPDIQQREKMDMAKLLHKKLTEAKEREEEENREFLAQQQQHSSEFDLLRVLPLLSMFNDFGDAQVGVRARVLAFDNDGDDHNDSHNEEDNHNHESEGNGGRARVLTVANSDYDASPREESVFGAD